MKLKRKLFSLVMSLSLVLGMAVAPVSAGTSFNIDDHFTNIKITTNAKYSETNVELTAKLVGLDDEGKQYLEKTIKGRYDYQIAYKHESEEEWQIWQGNGTAIVEPQKGVYEVKAQLMYRPSINGAPKFSKWGNVQKVKVGDVVTKATTIKSITSTTSSITIKWKKVPNALGYQVGYKPAGCYDRVYKKCSGTSYTVKNLKSASRYEVHVRPYYKIDGKTVYADYAGDMIATKPTKTTIKSVTSKKNSITVKWNDVSRESGYQVAYKKAKADKYTKVLVKKPSQVTKTIKKLSKNTKYNVKVRAYKYDSVNKTRTFGAWSKVKTIKTKAK